MVVIEVVVVNGDGGIGSRCRLVVQVVVDGGDGDGYQDGRGGGDVATESGGGWQKDLGEVVVATLMQEKTIKKGYM